MINIEFRPSLKRTFSKKLEVHRADLFKIAWSWCHDSALSDDLVQETYVKALKNRSQLKDLAKLKPWLTRILLNLHIDHLRAKKELVPFEDHYVLTEIDPSSTASSDESVKLVRNAIAQLNEKHRKIISLVDIAEFSYAEVAEILEIPVGTVMSRLSRARDQLKTLLYEIDNPQQKLPSSSNILRRVK